MIFKLWINVSKHYNCHAFKVGTLKCSIHIWKLGKNMRFIEVYIKVSRSGDLGTSSISGIVWCVHSGCYLPFLTALYRVGWWPCDMFNRVSWGSFSLLSCLLATWCPSSLSSNPAALLPPGCKYKKGTPWISLLSFSRARASHLARCGQAPTDLPPAVICLFILQQALQPGKLKSKPASSRSPTATTCAPL